MKRKSKTYEPYDGILVFSVICNCVWKPEITISLFEE